MIAHQGKRFIGARDSGERGQTQARQHDPQKLVGIRLPTNYENADLS